MELKKILKLILNDVAGAYPYMLIFYAASWLLSYFFESLELFFYWPAFDALMIIFGVMALASDRGIEFIFFGKNEFSKIIKTAKSAWRADREINLDFGKNLYNNSANSISRINGAYRHSKLRGIKFWQGRVISAREKKDLLEKYFVYLLKRIFFLAETIFKIIRIIASVFFTLAVEVARILFRWLILKIKTLDKKDFLKIGIMIFILLFAVSKNIEVINFGILAYALISVLFIIESRIAASIALLCLIYTPILLINKEEARAEIMAIYVYYFLVIAVITQIREYKKEVHPVKSRFAGAATLLFDRVKKLSTY